MTQATTSYVHRSGIHSETACQRNLLASAGHDVSEELIFGLDGGFGFSYFAARGDAADIVVGKQGVMPLRAVRLLGVEVAAHAPKSPSGLAALLDTAPAVMTRVDLGLLPHWGLEGRTSFGGYFVNVVRADGDRFEVSDPAYPDPVTIDAEDLQAARSSKGSAPLNPDWRCYVFGAAQASVQLDRVGPVAVRTLCREVRKPGSRNLGIPAMKALSAAAETWPATKQGEVEDVDLSGTVITVSALARQLLHVGRQIESFGTGGGLFRPVISRFLTSVGEATGGSQYDAAAELFARSGEQWSELGSRLLAESAAAGPGELAELAHEVAVGVRAAADLEGRALATLTTV